MNPADRAALLEGLHNIYRAAEHAKTLAVNAGDAAMLAMVKQQALEVQLALSMFDLPAQPQALEEESPLGLLYDQQISHMLRLTTKYERGEISKKVYLKSRATLRANFLKAIENERA